MSRTRHTPAWTLGLTSVALFMVALDALVVATALPAIQRDLHAGVGTLEWTVNAYSLTFAAAMITAAGLGDRFGRRRMYAAGLALFTLASAACALAPDAPLLLAARAAQGLGAAAVMTLSLTILTSAFPVERRGAVVGAWGAIGGLAVASGPLVGGAITQGIDWHWIFWVNVPIGALALPLSLRRLPESRGPDVRLDLPGLGLSAAGSSLLVWGLVRAGSNGWASPSALGAVLAALLILDGFVIWERRAPHPMLPPRLFASRSFTAANLAAFLMTAAIMSAAFLVAQYFQVGLGESPLSTGVHLLPWTATPTLIAPLAGRLSDRIGTRPLIAGGLTLQALGLAWFASEASTGVSYASLIAPLIVAGIGISLAIPTTPSAALSAVAARDVGKASGTSSTMQRFGGAFGVAISTAVFSASGQLGSAAGFDAGFRPALAVAAGISLVGAVAALFIAGRRARAVADPLPAVTTA
ncbi:MAG TPA: MFS transporter [Solirubrobacteraceae bacterium]|nr:MFS transporter [Solirubrobacteraceae bacterium]